MNATQPSVAFTTITGKASLLVPSPFRSAPGTLPSGRSARTPAYQVVAVVSTAGHRHGAVPGGSDGREPHHTLPGEIPHVEQLGRAGAGDDQAVHPRVHSRVENADHNAAPVVRGVLGAEVVYPGALQGHEADEQRTRRRQNGEPARDPRSRRRW